MIKNLSVVVLIAVGLLTFLVNNSQSATGSKLEKYYQTKWCNQEKGKMEVVYDNLTRSDCETLDYSVEVDFAPKWAEAIGQSLNYGLKSNKKAGIVLILKSKADYKHWVTMNEVITKYNLPIQVWTIEDFTLNY